MKKTIEKLKVTNWPLWLQLFGVFFLLFACFILLQQFVTNNVLLNFYTQTQASRLKDKINSYEADLENDYFRAQYDLFTKEGYISVIIEDGELLPSKYQYTITIDDNEIDIPSILYDYSIGDVLTVDFHDDKLVSISHDNSSYTYSNYTINRTVSGEVSNISRPNNFNYYFSANSSLIEQLKIYDSAKTKVFSLDENTSWYSNTNDNVTSIVFLHNISEQISTFTIYTTQDISKFVENLNIYNSYVYILLMIIMLATSWYVSKFIASPFENITYVADQLANLNFNAIANEFKNRESTTLTNSINKMSNSLNHTIDQLNAQNMEIRDLAEKQSLQFASKKQFVSAISHEIKTPLAIIQATVSGIIDGIFSPEEIQSELNNVLKEVNNTNEMIEEVLDIYRLDSDSFSLSLEKIEFISFVKKIINSFDCILDNSYIRIRYDCELEEAYVYIDYRQIKRVLTNLILNAIKHSPENSYIDIKIKGSRKEVLFEITNYGIQIPDQDLKNVFEPFYRVDKSGNRTERTSGSGLGLYIVKQILEKHGFSYGIRNTEEGVCSYFTVKRILN